MSAQDVRMSMRFHQLVNASLQKYQTIYSSVSHNRAARSGQGTFLIVLE